MHWWERTNYFLYSHGKIISTLYATCICVYNRWRSISLTRVLDSFLLYCSQCIPPSSQGVPSKFLMCSPVLFPIISHFYPICFSPMMFSFHLSRWAKRGLGWTSTSVGWISYLLSIESGFHKITDRRFQFSLFNLNFFLIYLENLTRVKELYLTLVSIYIYIYLFIYLFIIYLFSADCHHLILAQVKTDAQVFIQGIPQNNTLRGSDKDTLVRLKWYPEIFWYPPNTHKHLHWYRGKN